MPECLRQIKGGPFGQRKVRLPAALLFLFALCGCPPARPTHTQVITPRDAKIAAVRSHVRFMGAVLQILADSDIRLAVRVGDDIQSGDPFMVTERDAALEDALDEVSRQEFADTSLERDPEYLELLSEQEAFLDLVHAEKFRLEMELENPSQLKARAALDALPAMLMVIDSNRAEDPDTLLAWRLQLVRESLKPNSLSAFERDELRSILQGMSKRGPKTQTEVIAVSKRLESLPVAPFPLLSESDLDKQFKAFVGLPSSIDGVQPFLENAARTIRFQIDVAFSVLSPQAQEDVKRRAVAALLRPPPCVGAAHAQTPRQMGPPDERARSCAMVRLVAIAQTDMDELAALLTLYEAIVTAGRAATMHEKVRDPAVAIRKWPRLLQLGDGESRELMLAANHPVKAISAGIAAGLVMGRSPSNARKRAREWMRYGDGRFDAVERHLLLAKLPP